VNTYRLERRHPGFVIAARELAAMVPFFIGANGALLILTGVYGLLVKGIGVDVPLGLLVGNIVMLGHYLLIGVGADETLKTRKTDKAKFRSNTWFFIRYFGVFIIYAVLLTFGLISIATSLPPLFFPKIYYFASAFTTRHTE
jgi:hypothetical protein